jgi:hypothetical protein
MELIADKLRAGHSIDGAKVVWARPLPDGRSLVVALAATEGADGGAAWMRVYRVDDVIDVDDPPSTGV